MIYEMNKTLRASSNFHKILEISSDKKMQKKRFNIYQIKLMCVVLARDKTMYKILKNIYNLKTTYNFLARALTVL